MEIIENITRLLIYSIVGVIVFTTIVLLGFSFSSALTHRYWITVGEIVHYANSYGEHDNCISFVNEFGTPVTNCGDYTIKDLQK